MRLLNTKSHTFKELFDRHIPTYAILSHRWGDDEITFQEFRKGRNRDTQGYAKVKRFCALAEEEGFEWVWVDTCCIDKKSSAELSEAINSMYRWYHNAEKCYVYLSDVTWNSQDVEFSEMSFIQSSWFRRGWTLQELLAPKNVTFFDSAWNAFGTKKTLATQISAATEITVYQLHDRSESCIAQKMSWMSKRQTSRSEDMAYCMLGLFDVNMPLLYGEGGAKAFMRLQLEIIKQSDDESIFAWTSPIDTFGLLAPSPTCFAESGDIYPEFAPLQTRNPPYEMTNQGLQIEMRITREVGRYRFCLVLNCWKKSAKGPLAVVVELQKSATFDGWHRMYCNKLGLSERGERLSEKRSLQIIVYQPRSSQTVLENSTYSTLRSRTITKLDPSKAHNSAETQKVASTFNRLVS